MHRQQPCLSWRLRVIALLGAALYLLASCGRAERPAPATTTAEPTSPVAAPTPEPSNRTVEKPVRDLVVTIDRSSLPPLTYQALTLRIYVGDVEELEVLPPADTTHYSYDAETRWLTLTTAGDEVHLMLIDGKPEERVGDFEVAALKDDKAWAWSHSMDDNGNLRAAIAVLRSHGWRGTLYLVSDWIAPGDTGGYLLNETELRELLDEGWALGNHTRDHQCDPARIDRQTVLDGYEALRAIAGSSSRPDYRIISFAAPCMEWSYDPLLRDMIAAGETEALFNEADKRDEGYQNYYRIVIEADAAVEEEWRTTHFDPALPIGRNFDFESDEEGKGPAMVIADLDEIAALAGPKLHFWYNTASHGSGEQKLQEVAAHVFERYGPGGTDEAWVAPAEEIYSYLLVRDGAIVRVEDQDG